MKRWGSFIVLLTIACAMQASQSVELYDSVLFGKDIMIAMRDGTKLATDIYRPGRSGVAVSDRLPVLLQRTPYNKEAAGVVANAKFFAQHGYVVALQDIRGRYKSEGSFGKYDESSATDGYDTIQWLTKQPYTNGEAGMWGTS